MSLENEKIDKDLMSNTQEGFYVPEGYFNQLHNDILRKTVENGFYVPEGYFEDLEPKILKKINQSKVIQHNFAFKQLAIGIAASIIFISGFFFLKSEFYSLKTSSNISEINLKNLSDEDIINSVDLEDIEDNPIIVTASNFDDKTQKSDEKYFLNNTDEQDIIEQL